MMERAFQDVELPDGQTVTQKKPQKSSIKHKLNAEVEIILIFSVTLEYVSESELVGFSY